jgi:hypothetical protein
VACQWLAVEVRSRSVVGSHNAFTPPTRAPFSGCSGKKTKPVRLTAATVGCPTGRLVWRKARGDWHVLDSVDLLLPLPANGLLHLSLALLASLVLHGFVFITSFNVQLLLTDSAFLIRSIFYRHTNTKYRPFCLSARSHPLLLLPSHPHSSGRSRRHHLGAVCLAFFLPLDLLFFSFFWLRHPLTESSYCLSCRVEAFTYYISFLIVYSGQLLFTWPATTLYQ